MTISEIYKKYKINKGLQEHMIRVAAVGKLVCGNYEGEIQENEVITACLLYDMGNLIKSKLTAMPELLEPEGVEYWANVKEAVIKKYGNDVHGATIAMIREINVGDKVIEIIEASSFDQIEEVSESGSINAKILEYADMRVGPFGIISLKDRFQYLEQRYVPERWTKEQIALKLEAAQRIEKQIFSNACIDPEDITDESTKEIQEKLYGWEIA